MKKKKKGPSVVAPQQRHVVRELRAEDVEKGLLETLENLSDTGGLGKAEARSIVRTMKRHPLYHVFVAVTGDGQIIGTTTLLVEQKLIHHGGLVGHIEDVVVRKGHEGKGVGGSLVRAAVERANQLGCYKCILDCKPELTNFYENLGFRKHDVGMRVDLKRVAPQGR